MTEFRTARMNRIFFILLIYCLITSNSLNAQESEKNNIKQLTKTFSNTYYKSIFKSNPNLDSIGIEFKEKRPVFMILYFHSVSQDLKSENAEFFDLGFEGDIYVLKKGFIKDLPLLPKAEIEYMDSLQQFVEYFRLNAIIYSDSVTYRFLPPPSIDASYKGDLKQLGELLEREYGKKNYDVTGDSILIFQGVVNRDGNLGDVGLIVGEYSPFSEFIQQNLKDQGSSWYPMIKGGRPLRSLVDIYIRFNSDKSISVSVTGRSRKLKIKDYDKSTLIFF